ncbi:MAG: hypothetical protein QCH35_11295 [Methanomicrobiaceae archaeon]|nr:hypothetical protein [Methanomicrobiaceae archaeon]
MKEESRLSEQIASIQAGLVSASDPLLHEAFTSGQAIGNLLSQALSFSTNIASFSILRVAHVPPIAGGEGESEEKESAVSPAAPSADGPPTPVSVAVSVHLSPIPAVLSEFERCVTEMIEKIPPIQADLASLVSMPASAVMRERQETEGGGFPLVTGSTELPAGVQKVSTERMLRDLPATLLTGIGGGEAFTGPLFTPPGIPAPVHHHLHAGGAPEVPGGSGEPPARQPLAISPLILLREILRPAQQEIPSRSISPFLHGIARPAGREAPPGFSPIRQKILRQRMGGGARGTSGESRDTAPGTVYREGGFTEKGSVVQLSPLHVLSTLIAPPGAASGTGALPLPSPFSPALPVRLLSQSVPFQDREQAEPAPDSGLFPAAAPLRTDTPVPAAIDARSPVIAPFTPPLPIAFLEETAPVQGGRGQHDLPPTPPADRVARSIFPVGKEAKTAVHPPGIARDRSGLGMVNAQAGMARSLLNPILVPSTVSLAGFSRPMAQDAGGEGSRGPVPLPFLSLRLLTSTSPFAAGRGESALKEPFSRVHPARFILSLLTGEGGSDERASGFAESLPIPATEAGQAMHGIRAVYGPVLPRAVPSSPQEGMEGGYPALAQLQQIISVYSGAGTPVQVGSLFSGVLQPMASTVNVMQPPAPPVKVTTPDIRRTADATARQASLAGDRPITFHNNFEISVQVKGGATDGDIHELGRKIGNILADEMRRHGGR